MKLSSQNQSWLFLLLFIAVSCGSDADSGSQQVALVFKQTSNTVFARFPAEPDRLNPILATSAYARAINEQIFQNLLHFDPYTLELRPQLAAARPVVREVADGKYAGGVGYTFNIREEAVWDDGSPITAEDVAFTMKAIFNPLVNAAHVRAYMEFVSGFETDPSNPRAFTVYTNEKYIIGEPVVSNISVLPKAVYDPSGLLDDIPFSELADAEKASRLAKESKALQAFAEAFNSAPYSREKDFISGSGPYRFVRWETGQELVLEKKEGWWGESIAPNDPLLSAYPQTLSFKIIPDQVASMAALKDEQVDVVSQIDAKDFTDLQANEEMTRRFSLQTPPSMVYYYVGLNNKNPKLADKRVRRAIAHLLDVDELINTLYYGLAQRTVGPFHPTKPYYHDELPLIAYNPEKARALLAEAGWEDTNGNGIVDKVINGMPTELALEYMISAGSKFANNMALIFQDNARKAGVEITIAPKEFTVLTDHAKRRDYDMYAGAWGQDPVVDDPKQLWHSESDTPSGGNRVSFNNAEADRLIDEIRETLDEEKRNALYLKFQELIYEEQPYIFLFAPLERIAISKRFEAKTSARRPGFFVNDFKQKNIQ